MTNLRHVVLARLRENAFVSIDYATSKLLVATPRTGGEVFRRSVVLVLHHDEDGAQGVVLNRPLAAPVSSVLPPGRTTSPIRPPSSRAAPSRWTRRWVW